jgi:hypothetical protein
MASYVLYCQDHRSGAGAWEDSRTRLTFKLRGGVHCRWCDGLRNYHLFMRGRCR